MGASSESTDRTREGCPMVARARSDRAANQAPHGARSGNADSCSSTGNANWVSAFKSERSAAMRCSDAPSRMRAWAWSSSACPSPASRLSQRALPPMTAASTSSRCQREGLRRPPSTTAALVSVSLRRSGASSRSSASSSTAARSCAGATYGAAGSGCFCSGPLGPGSSRSAWGFLGCPVGCPLGTTLSDRYSAKRAAL